MWLGEKICTMQASVIRYPVFLSDIPHREQKQENRATTLIKAKAGIFLKTSLRLGQ